MELRRGSVRPQKRLPRFKPRAAWKRPVHLQAQLTHDAFDLFGAAQHACLAREILDRPLRIPCAQYLAGQIEVGNVFGDELVQAGIGYAERNRHGASSGSLCSDG